MSPEELMLKVLGDSFTHYVGKEVVMKQRTEHQLRLQAPPKPKLVEPPKKTRVAFDSVLEEVARKHYAAGKYSFQRVLDVCCAVHGVAQKDVLSPNRANKLVLVRRHLVVILKEKRGLSYLEIGRKLNRDHSTLIHAYNSAVNNPKILNEQYEEIISRLENYSG